MPYWPPMVPLSASTPRAISSPKSKRLATTIACGCEQTFRAWKRTRFRSRSAAPMPRRSWPLPRSTNIGKICAWRCCGLKQKLNFEKIVKCFFKNQIKKLSKDDIANVKRAREQGHLHTELLDRRAGMKSDKYCKWTHTALFLLIVFQTFKL